MFTAIMTAAWRGFGVDKGDGYTELRLGFISFAIVKGTLWKHYKTLKEQADSLQNENGRLKWVLYGDSNHE